MKRILSLFITLARAPGLIGLLCLFPVANMHAEVSSKAFGVWDRGDSFDPKEYPFLKGLSFSAPWSEVEREDGVFDWSALDKTVEKAVRSNSFLNLSLGVGPEAPEWIYKQGIPRVFTDDSRHKGNGSTTPTTSHPPTNFASIASSRISAGIFAVTLRPNKIASRSYR